MRDLIALIPDDCLSIYCFEKELFIRCFSFLNVYIIVSCFSFPLCFFSFPLLV